MPHKSSESYLMETRASLIVSMNALGGRDLPLSHQWLG